MSIIVGVYLEFFQLYVPEESYCPFLVIDGMVTVFCRQASPGTGVRPTLTTAQHSHVETEVPVSIK